MTITGLNFLSNAQVKVNGSSVSTTFVSPTQLTAVFPGSVIPDTGGKVPVTVVTTPSPPASYGGGTSQPVNFSGYEATATISKITPDYFVFGGDDIEYTIYGTGFIPGKTLVSLIYINPNDLDGASSDFTTPNIRVMSSTEIRVVLGTFSFLTPEADRIMYASVINPGQEPQPGGNHVVVPGGPSTLPLNVITPEVTLSGLGVGSATGSSATVSWQTSLNSFANTVEYGTTPSLGQAAYPAQTGYGQSRDHHVALSGLMPDTLYYFEVSSSGPVNTVTATGTFVTGKAPGNPTIMVSGATVSRSGSTVTATLTLKNSGDGAATDLVLNSATLGGASATVSLPQSQGPVAAGGTITVSLTFAGVPSGASTLKVQGTYAGGAGGSFDLNRRVSVP